MKRMGLGFAAILTGLSAAAYLGLPPVVGGREIYAKPPVARVVPKAFEEYGKQRVDNYYWMRESENPEVIAYLEAENVYADARIARLRPLIDEIFGMTSSFPSDPLTTLGPKKPGQVNPTTPFSLPQ